MTNHQQQSKPYNRVVCVPASFMPLGKEEVVKVATGETKKSLFGKEKAVMRKEKQWVQTCVSESMVDTIQLEKDLQLACDHLNKDGYEVINISPITSGDNGYQVLHTKGGKEKGGFNYGFSYTSGLMVTAKRAG